ncbi:hypothetical protein [Carboxylicivirga marina]|uniref:Uncharacterized protein n=1 Tax=Carboxylicivirga marina TaxID=2800988 RepID=A0ABS1HGP2_9BACT|nr:hypothetical protein [Carboxylicivirga marina]MBK3516809.1 hypothetical protein [Carboxylicivirga marina]
MMNRLITYIFVTIGFLLTPITETKAQSINFRTDLEKYNGFYTAIEMTGGNIPIEKIPDRIRNYKDRL